MPVSQELRPPLIRAHDYLRYYAELQRRAGRQVVCVQIGANDGVSSDPVHEYFTAWGWRGLLAEPLPDVFERLTETYQAHPDVRAVNTAIAASSGSLPFYRLKDAPAAMATGLSSLRREHLQAHLDRGYVDGVIETVTVPTQTFESFLDEHRVDAFDVLVTDCEGYDLEVLRLVDFDRHRPDVVLFESDNLSDAEYRSALDLLRGHGYELRWSFLDTLAIRVPYPRRAAFSAALRDFVPRARHKFARIRRAGAASVGSAP